MRLSLNTRVATLVVVALLATSALAPAVALAAGEEDSSTNNSSVRSADLQVWQPHYVKGGVAKDTAGKIPLYTAHGRVLDIQPQNFNSSDVVGVQIQENVAASIKYDSAREVYVLDTKGTSGTYTIIWKVQETVQKNVVRGNTTTTVNETVIRSYGARVKAVKTNLVHIEESSFKQTRQDAQNWSEVVDLYGPLQGPLQQSLQFGANLVKAYNHPWGALSGDFGRAVQAVFMSAGGLLFFALLMVPNIVYSWRTKKENKELKEKIGDYESIEEALDDIFTDKRKRYLREQSLNDWFTDRDAAWLRRNGFNDPWVAFRKLMTMLSPKHLDGIVAGAMLDSGQYRAVVRKQDVATDGGADDVDDAIVSVDMIGADGDPDLGPTDDVLETSDELSLDLMGHVDSDELDSEVLRDGSVNLESAALPVSNHPDSEDWVSELNVSIPEDFETREHYAAILENIIKKVAATEFVDREGRPRADRDLANFLISFASIGGEVYNEPYLRYIRDLMIHNADQLDADARARSVVEESRDNTERTGSRTES